MADGRAVEPETGFIEPNLNFVLLEGGKKMRVYFELESRPSWAAAAWAGTADLWVEFTVVPEMLRDAATSLRLQLAKFPARAGLQTKQGFLAPASRFVFYTDPMTSPKAFLFDLDGTLADTDPLHFLAYQGVFADLGVTIDRDIYTRRMSGRHNPDLLADFFPEHSAERNIEIADAKETRFRELATAYTPLPGATEFLEGIAARGARLALVTNAPRANAEHVLRLLGFDTRFETVVVAGELARPKPDPLPYLHALEHLGVAPENGFAFEDSLSGVRSAVAAGLYTVGLTTSESAERLLEVGASITAADFTEPQVKALLNLNVASTG